MNESKINTPINIDSLHLENRIMNGAGPSAKLLEDAERIFESKAAAVVVGSITLESREGNLGRNYYIDPQGMYSINSMGLPNGGLEYYVGKKVLKQMTEMEEKYNKPLILSVAGFSPEEYAMLTTEALNQGVKNIELNAGCPNVVAKDGNRKPILSYNPDGLDTMLRLLQSEVGNEGWLSLKLSPYFDPEVLKTIAQIINATRLQAIVTSNTIPNTFSFNQDNQAALDVAGGYGGMAGRALKPTVMGQVRQFRNLLSPKIEIIAAGGINTEQDVEDYLNPDVGAVAGQITTGLLEYGVSIFVRIRGME